MRLFSFGKLFCDFLIDQTPQLLFVWLLTFAQLVFKCGYYLRVASIPLEKPVHNGCIRYIQVVILLALELRCFLCHWADTQLLANLNVTTDRCWQ